MKKLFSLLMVVFTALSITAHAQNPTSIKIVNNSHCEICFYLMGAKGPECLPVIAKTSVICIPPGGTVNFPNTAAAPFSPPLGTSGIFSGLCWYNHNPAACSDVPLDQRCIFDKCAGTPQTDKLDVYDGDCKRCGSVTGKWSSSGGMATVVFN